MRAAACRSLDRVSALLGLVGFTRSAMVLAAGTSSVSTSSCFCPNSTASEVAPVKKLSAILNDRKVSWQRLRISLWYGRTNRLVEVTTGTAIWYKGGIPPVPIRWVLVRDPAGELEPQAFLATDLNARPCDIIAWFVCRWQVEVTFEEVRAHLGVETQRQW